MELTLVNVGQNTTLGDGDVSEKLVQLLIVADGEGYLCQYYNLPFL